MDVLDAAPQGWVHGRSRNQDLARRAAHATTLLLTCALLLSACGTAPRRPPPQPTPTQIPPPPPNIQNIPDAIPKPEPRSKFGNPPFYDVLGKRYLILPTADGYVERGVASWYGPTFHGVRTSTGEPYDMYAMTAAHKTLPLPAYARVTNLSNGKTVVVRINDRGPFVANRIIDLSYTAAAKLDMLRTGTTLVEVRALTPGRPDALSRADETPPATLYIQAGAFANEANAQRLYERLQHAGLSNANLLSPLNGASRLYRVRLGPVGSVSEFDALAAKLSRLGIPDARLVVN